MMNMGPLPARPLEHDLGPALLGGLAFVLGYLLIVRLRRSM